ncbi:trypsin-like peptidase domain-containing protein [Azospirillum sp. sgz302134]
MRNLAGSTGVALALLAAGVLTPRPLPAVVILDSAWREEGGARGREADGFGAHIRLANEPQFRSLVSLSSDGGREWGVGSGTWIGNDEAHGYVMTSAHNFDEAELAEMRFRTDGGSVLRGDRVWIHQGYETEGDHTGVDVAIVRLSRPVTDAGPPPLLYAGAAEKGKTITFIGFGTRGIGSVGEDERFNRGTDKAAAQGVVDEAVPLRRGGVRQEDPGNFLSVFLPREDGHLENPITGARRPVSRYAGLLGAGDSGGSAWMPLGDRWVVVGINTSGDGKSQYGDNSWFVRVSGVRSWIASVFPGARFAGDGDAYADRTPAPPPRAAEPSLREASLRPEPSKPARTASAGCAADERFFVLSDGAWYPASTLGPGDRPSTCRVRFDDYDEDQDEDVVRRRMVPWTASGPGVPVTNCRSGAIVLAEDDGVWYPATVEEEDRRGCLVTFENDDTETVPFRRLRVLR